MKNLVRDKIPQDIISTGRIPVVRYLSSEDFRSALLNKVVEEAIELRDSASPEEVADIYEVLNALCIELGLSTDSVDKFRKIKLETKGGFKTRAFLEKIVDPVDSCELCREFTSRICPYLVPERNRILYENDKFVVLPSLGSFIEGYLLLFPKVHLPSIAQLDRRDLLELECLLNKVTKIITSEYGKPLVFEHGSLSSANRAGASIDHAHLHVVPCNVDLLQVLDSKFKPEELNCWSDLILWRDRPYLLTQSQAGKILICEVRENLPSQFLRRHLATELNRSDLWNWRIYIGLEEISKTLARFESLFIGEMY